MRCKLGDGGKRGYSSVLAHRAAWEALNGKTIPPNLVIHHMCLNKACSEPEHLIAVTPEMNHGFRRKDWCEEHQQERVRYGNSGRGSTCKACAARKQRRLRAQNSR